MAMLTSRYMLAEEAAVELYQLKTFVKVAQAGNLTRASEALFTSQPAVSAQIKALEDELGVQLFSRTPKGMQLTPAGQHLFQHAERTLAAAETIRQEAQALRNDILAELKIGVHTDFQFMQTGRLFQALAALHPRITLHFLNSSSATVVQQLRGGQLDAGFMFGPCQAADMQLLRLSDVPLQVVAPMAWASDVVNASLGDLATMPWVYTSRTCPFYHYSEALFADSDQPPEKLVWVDTEDAVRELVKAGAGLAIIRQDDAQRLQAEGYVCIWSQSIPAISLSFITAKRRSQEAAIRAFAECVQQHWCLPAGCQLEAAG